MKFDKFMEHCYKILCLVTAMVVFVGVLVSCASRPVSAHAVDISSSEQAGIQDFLDAYASNLISIDFELNSDSDGNRNVRLSVLSSQTLFYNELLNIYDNMDFSLAPDTINFSGTSCSGLYRSELDNQIHAVTLCPPPALGTYSTSLTHTFATSDEYNLTVSLVSSDNPIQVVSRHFNDGSYFPNYYNGYSSFSIATFHGTLSLQSNSYFSGFTHSEYRYGEDGLGFSISNENTIPTMAINTTFYLGHITNLGGSGATSALPNESVDTITPWDYYNDYLLPDIINNYDIDNIEQYLVFPDGYSPEVPPTEPNYNNTNNVYIIPIIIGDPLPVDITDDLGNILDVLDILADLLPDGGLQFQIDGVTISFPRDGDNVVINGRQYPLPLPDFQIDGHTINLPDNLHFDFDGVPFIINPDGTITINGDTYNLPIGTPTQLTTDYDKYIYEYEIPTIERLNVVDAELSSPDLTYYVSGISLVSGAMSDFLDGVGLMPFIIACLSLGAITYVIWKIGG